MTFKAAVKLFRRQGASRATPLPLLAATCQTLAGVHAVNPELLYTGAARENLTARDLTRLAGDPAALGRLMFPPTVGGKGAK